MNTNAYTIVNEMGETLYRWVVKFSARVVIFDPFISFLVTHGDLQCPKDLLYTSLSIPVYNQNTSRSSIYLAIIHSVEH